MASVFRRYLAVFWLPALLLGGHVGVRALGFRPLTDIDGTSAVLRVAFLCFGASVAYFMTLLPSWARRPGDLFWTLVALWFAVMIVDDSFMVHEELGKALGIADSIPLIVLGLALVGLLIAHQYRLRRPFWAGFCGFAALSVVALAGDILTGREGVVHIAGFGFDYEQTAELLAVFCLSAGFAAQALGELVLVLSPSVPPVGPGRESPGAWRRLVTALRRRAGVHGPRFDVGELSSTGDGQAPPRGDDLFRQPFDGAEAEEDEDAGRPLRS